VGGNSMAEGPFTKIGAISGVIALVVGYLALAAAVHWAPFHTADNPVSSANTTSPNSVSTNTLQTGNSPASSGGPSLEYDAVSFHMQGLGCPNGDSGYLPVATFTAQGPQVTEVFGPPSGAGPVYLDCSSPPNISFGGNVWEVNGKPSAAACLSALSNASAMAIDVASLNAGMGFCYSPGGGSGNQVVFLRLVSVNQSTYDTSWSATAWDVP